MCWICQSGIPGVDCRSGEGSGVIFPHLAIYQTSLKTGILFTNPGMDLFIGLLVFCLVTSLFPLYFYRGVHPHQEMVRKRNSGENATNPGMDLLYFFIFPFSCFCWFGSFLVIFFFSSEEEGMCFPPLYFIWSPGAAVWMNTVCEYQAAGVSIKLPVWMNPVWMTTVVRHRWNALTHSLKKAKEYANILLDGMRHLSQRIVSNLPIFEHFCHPIFAH